MSVECHLHIRSFQRFRNIATLLDIDKMQISVNEL